MISMKLYRLVSVLLPAVMICSLPACGGTGSGPASVGISEPMNTAAGDESFAVDSTSFSETADSDSSVQETAQTPDSTLEITASATNAPTTVHRHFFAGADCTTAGQCDCGAVGAALGHDFSAKSCTAPATCKRCGATNGSALGHSYAGGKCKRCGDTNGPLKPSEAALFRNKLTDEENAQALAVARDIVEQIDAQLPEGPDIDRIGMAASLVSQEYRKGVHVEKGSYYSSAYGVFVKRESSCAGCCRALGLVLSCMGYQWSHVNENQWTHQWISLTIDGQPVWADGQIGWVGIGEHPAA